MNEPTAGNLAINHPPRDDQQSLAPEIRNPPKTVFGIFGYLGPGLIIAASIVGSGELIATTGTGAKAGFSLLWLIIVGCIIKVFTQVEIGRYTIISSMPTLSALNQVPGPRIPHSGNWLVLYWFFMWFASIAQLGGIVGSVGQAMSLAVPITEQGRAYNEANELKTQLAIEIAIRKRLDESSPNDDSFRSPVELQRQADMAVSEYRQRYSDQSPKLRDQSPKLSESMENPSSSATFDSSAKLVAPLDDRIWTIPFCLITSILLVVGKYRVIQAVSTTMVAAFTAITVGNLISLQGQPSWAVTWQEWTHGLSCQLPQTGDSSAAIGMALATMGIIGVGAAELIQYPYWCLEKGYGRWTGRQDGSSEWIMRAKGWIRVLYVDAWASMIIYTFATIAFYLLGAAILHRASLVPSGSDMIRTLAVMYQPVFSNWAPVLFLTGAFFVLYSTFYVANASHARTFADGLSVVGLISNDPVTQRRWVAGLSGLFPLLCGIVFWIMPQPVTLVYFSGMAQAIMLPMLCFAALYFRYVKCLPELRPSKLWDGCLWLSAAVMLIIGVWSFGKNMQDLFPIFAW